MRPLLRCLLAGLIIAGAPKEADGQSLRVRKANGVYNVEVSGTPEIPVTVQVSHNMRIWIDLRENVQETLSLPVDHAGEAERYYRLIPAAEPAPPIRVMILGDSMSADCCGWGYAMPNFFKENALVLNYSEPWTSTKVFLNGPNYQRMIAVEPNYVFVAFASSDGGINPETNASAEEFRANLLRIAATIRGFNGIPIMMTLHAPRWWNEDGRLDTWEHQYNWVIREVARDIDTPLIDLYKITFPLWEKLGPQGAAFFHWEPGGDRDAMHTSAAGAPYLCRLLLRDGPLSLAPYLKAIYDTPPPPP